MRLIDADALKEIISGNSYILRDSINSMNFGMFWDGIEQAIDESPTIDAVPVVWCKDCKYWDKDTLRHNSNDVAEWDECECEMLANRDRWNEIDRYCCGLHFCADGERRNDETD